MKLKMYPLPPPQPIGPHSYTTPISPSQRPREIVFYFFLGTWKWVKGPRETVCWAWRRGNLHRGMIFNAVFAFSSSKSWTKFEELKNLYSSRDHSTTCRVGQILFCLRCFMPIKKLWPTIWVGKKIERARVRVWLIFCTCTIVLILLKLYSSPSACIKY